MAQLANTAKCVNKATTVMQQSGLRRIVLFAPVHCQSRPITLPKVATSMKMGARLVVIAYPDTTVRVANLVPPGFMASPRVLEITANPANALVTSIPTRSVRVTLLAENVSDA